MTLSTAVQGLRQEEIDCYRELRKEAEQAARAKPIIIEIPFGEPAPEPNVRRCNRLRRRTAVRVRRRRGL